MTSAEGGNLLCGPKVERFSFIKAQSDLYPVQLLCELMNVSRSAYYEWLEAIPAPRIEANRKGIQGISPRAYIKTTRDDTDLENSPNLIKDESLAATSIDRIWVSDITFIPTKEGWLFVCIVLDLCS